ncbi:MAG: glutamate 5-kinase [Verrucomicrobiales bacterium]
MSEIVVFKVGTGVLTQDNGSLDGASLVRLVTALAELKKAGCPFILVSSGAVGAGVPILGLDRYPDDVQTRQAAAALGQVRLMHNYQMLFAQFDMVPAQILLTRGDTETAKRRNRIKRTLVRLLEETNVVPIVNENDSVAVNELRIGDNDMLSARLAKAMDAKRLVLLSTINGLMNEGGEVIEEVRDIEEVLHFVRDESGRFSIGGMASKLKAVRFALQHNIEVMIANGRDSENLERLIHGEGRGTRFFCPDQPVNLYDEEEEE